MGLLPIASRNPKAKVWAKLELWSGLETKQESGLETKQESGLETKQEPGLKTKQNRPLA
jgi:hypothetical protein